MAPASDMIAPRWLLSGRTSLEPVMMKITTIGLDLAKNVLQVHVHAIGSTGEVLVRRSLRRAQVIPFFSKFPRCLIGMEACGTSHQMPPAYVKPYVKRCSDGCSRLSTARQRQRQHNRRRLEGAVGSGRGRR
jgi:transposase